MAVRKVWAPTCWRKLLARFIDADDPMSEDIGFLGSWFCRRKADAIQACDECWATNSGCLEGHVVTLPDEVYPGKK
jgi:hypothetical protein